MSPPALVGRLLRGVRAGDHHLAGRHSALAAVADTLDLTSGWFVQDGLMPAQTAGVGVGANISPPLRWSPPPDGAVEIAILLEDPDVPLPRPYVHLIAHGLPINETQLAAGRLNAGTALAFGRNTNGAQGYAGPRALPGHGEHRYIFTVLALDRALAFPAPPKLPAFLDRIAGAVLAKGSLVGRFAQS